MRKILLATTALVGFAVVGAAQAATSPLQVTVGGTTDFVAGQYHESDTSNASSSKRTSHDFETLYTLDFGVKGKAANGIEYGGDLSLSNAPDISNWFGSNNNGIGNGVDVDQANIFLSGAFGKVVLGDSHGATDLVVGTPTVGAGQVYGRYIDFLGTTSFAKNFVAGVDGTDHSTNVTYFTPKVGNEAHKVQLGVSYVPQFYNYGANTSLNTTSNTLSPYKDVVKGALAYTGKFAPVTVNASAHVIAGSSDAGFQNQTWLTGLNNRNGIATGLKVRDFTSYGFGAQAAYNGFTLGGSYTDLGHYDTVYGQTKDQDLYSAGLKYEFSKVGVGVSYLGGEGYANTLSSAASGGSTVAAYDYIKDFNAYGVGGTYTWAPGLTTNVDGVFFDQKSEANVKNDGYVLLLSQKLAF